MKRILLILSILFAVLNAGFIPQRVETEVTAVNGNTLSLAGAFAYNGMSGLVIRRLSSGEYAIATIKQISPGKAEIIDTEPFGGKGLANIKPVPKVGDKVIGGFMYNRIMVLAPNRNTFENIQNRFGISSVNPDIFMGFLAKRGSDNPTADDYKAFAKLTHVGLFVIFKNGFITLYDPLSETEIAKTMMDVSVYNAMQPFYNTFK